jgi:hypothetical protein
MECKLFKLPSSILIEICSKYLTIDSVGFLDIAVAETCSRQILLQLFQSADFFFEDNRDRYGHDLFSWSKEQGRELCSDSICEYAYVTCNHRQEQSNKDAEIFFLWLQKRKKHVSLIGWLNIKDAGMRVLRESCSTLESLTMYKCDDITDEGIQGIAKGLLSLSLIRCDQVTGTGIGTGVVECSLLVSLHLTHCNHVNDQGISRIAESCSMLQSVDLTNCDEITDEGVCRLAEGCTMLRSLNLEFCSSITEKITIRSTALTSLIISRIIRRRIRTQLPLLNQIS